MLRVVLEAHVEVEVVVEHAHERVDRALAPAFVRPLLAVDDEVDLDPLGGGRVVDSPGLGAQPHDLEAAPGLVGVVAGQVLVVEDAPDLLGGELASGLSVLLDGLGELDLHAARQIETVLALEQVGHAAFSRLRVHADDRLVRAAEILRVDGQVGHVPFHEVDRDPVGLRIALTVGEGLVDRILVRTGERGEDEVAAVGVTFVDADLVAFGDRVDDLVDVGEVEFGIDALRVEVERDGDEVEVAGPLPVAEQAAFDPISARHDAELGRSDPGPAVVVRVEGDGHLVAVGHVPAEPFDLVGVCVRGAAFDGGGQVDDGLASGGGLPHVEDGADDVEGELGFGVDEDLRRVLVAEVRVAEQRLGVLHHRLGPLQGDVAGLVEAVAVEAEDDLAEDRGGRVVEVDGGHLRPDERFDGAFDEVLARLGEDGDPHVVGDRIIVDDRADEVEVDLTRRGEPDLDLLEPEFDEEIEHPPLAIGGHRVDERLVAVAQVGAQPARGLPDDLVGPSAVAHVERDPVLERLVLLVRHGGRLLQIHHSSSSLVVRISMEDSATRALSVQDSSRHGRRMNL
ncbi:Uncharacterised protein [Mycobacteroides abscessus subsp. abscessus]|nr:Uncharacterised protein [Mycobacteroides abscessus subsp. abscessus]